MADLHPYIITKGNVSETIAKLRNKFQSEINVGVIKKLNVAKGNEKSVVNLLIYIGVYDKDGKQTPVGVSTFSKHKDEEFAQQLSKLVKNAYSDLFDTHGDLSWNMTEEDLVAFFKETDKKTDITARRQALAFSTLAVLCNLRTVETASSMSGKKADRSGNSKSLKQESKVNLKEKKNTGNEIQHNMNNGDANGDCFKPSVHIDVQIHISPESSAEQIDHIFSSMRKHIFSRTSSDG